MKKLFLLLQACVAFFNSIKESSLPRIWILTEREELLEAIKDGELLPEGGKNKLVLINDPLQFKKARRDLAVIIVPGRFNEKWIGLDINQWIIDSRYTTLDERELRGRSKEIIIGEVQKAIKVILKR